RVITIRDIMIVTENTGWLAGHIIVEGATHGQDPTNFSVRTDNPELEIEWFAATHGSVPFSFDSLNVVGMHSVTKIRITSYGSGLEPKDGLEFGSPSDLARVQVPIP